MHAQRLCDTRPGFHHPRGCCLPGGGDIDISTCSSRKVKAKMRCAACVGVNANKEAHPFPRSCTRHYPLPAKRDGKGKRSEAELLEVCATRTR
jgi:hypothetical protein